MSKLILSTRSYHYMRDGVCAAGGFEPADVEIKIFPDGERYQRILSAVNQRDVVLIGGTISDADTLELYDLACGAVQCGARTLTLVIPYFGHSTMERATHDGDVVTAKARARLFSAVPTAINGNRVVLVDLHSEGLPYYFEGDVHPVHLYAKAIVVAAARRMWDRRPGVLACTDAGRAKWVESLANDLGVPASFVFKKRLDGERTEVIAVSAAVQGQDVIIYDDMIRTGGSLIDAARAYQAAGAASVSAIATHGVLPGEALQRIRSSGLFKEVVCTDSHPRAVALKSDFLKVETLAGLFAEYLRKQ